MWLIHVTVEDEVRVAYVNRFTPNTREEIDAQTSINVQQTISEQLIAHAMNDLAYNPTSRLLPELHDLFAKEHNLLYGRCMNKDITPKEVKKKW